MPIWKHKNRWYVKIMRDGVTYRGECGYETEAEARLELAKLQCAGRLAKSEGNLPPNPLFRDAWTLYLQHSEAYNSEKWYEAKRYIGNRYFQKWFDRTINSITPSEIETHMVERKVKSVRSANLDFEILRNFFHWCAQREFLDKSPMRFLRRFPGSKTVRIVPQKAEIEALIQNNEGQDKLLILLLVNTMGRISEIKGLRWSDIDLQRKIIRLKTRKTKDGSEKIREIPINGLLLDMLKSLEPKDGYILTSPSHLPYQDLRKKLKKCLTQAGITSRLGFHVFRHYGISRLMEAGVDPATIRDLAGHSTIEMTGLYSHSSEAVRRKAMEALQ